MNVHDWEFKGPHDCGDINGILHALYDHGKSPTISYRVFYNPEVMLFKQLFHVSMYHSLNVSHKMNGENFREQRK